MTVFDPYLRGYLAGMAAAKKVGPVDKATLQKLRVVAADLARVIGRKEPIQ